MIELNSTYGDLEQAPWDCYTGDKLFPNKGGYYLLAGMSGATMLCFIVTRVKSKKRKLSCFILLFNWWTQNNTQ